MPGIHTFTAGEVLTANNVNVFLMNQAVAQVTSGSRPGSPQTGQTIYQTDNNLLLVYDSAGHWVQITPASATVATQETTTSATYTNLSTTGPSVTVTTGTSALVTMSAQSYNPSTAGNYIAVAVSGATTIAAADVNDVVVTVNTNFTVQMARTFLLGGLTAGANTFTLMYKTSTGTAQFGPRDLTVVGIP